MKTQEDSKVRMVALENLHAMCKRASGMSHHYKVVKVTRSRVYVKYSNPDEWGRDRPVIAVFPCFQSPWSEDEENPRVVLQLLRVLHKQDGEDWQAFDVLLDCPTLYRVRLKPEEWRSHREIRDDGGESDTVKLSDTCFVCDLPKTF